MKKLSQMTPAERSKRVAQLIKNPATRSAVPAEYLPANYRQQRDMNTRLNAPAVPGSTLTNRDVSRQAGAAAEVKYGDAQRQAQTNITESQQLGKDQAHWYDDYLAKVGQGAQRQEQIGKDAVAGVSSLAGAFGAPDTAGQTAGVAGDAAKGASVREAILRNVGAVTQAQAGNQNSYMNQLANVVAPGQKLQAQASGAANTQKFRDALGGLLKEVGAYKEQVKGDTIAGEQKNVLAQQAFGLDVTKAATQAAQNSPEGKSAAAAATSEATTASKYGRTVHQWRLLGPDGRAAAIKASKSKPADTVYSSGPFAGRKKSEIDGMSAGGRQTLVDRYDKSKGPGKTKSPYLGTSQQNTFQNTVASTKATVGKLKDSYDRLELRRLLQTGRGAQTVYVDANGKVLPNVTDLTTAHKQGGHAVKIPAIPKIADEAALSAALDAVYDGHLSPATIKKLHKKGYKVNGLGISTKRPSQTATVVNDAISSVGTAISGIG